MEVSFLQTTQQLKLNKNGLFFDKTTTVMAKNVSKSTNVGFFCHFCVFRGHQHITNLILHCTESSKI